MKPRVISTRHGDLKFRKEAGGIAFELSLPKPPNPSSDIIIALTR